MAVTTVTGVGAVDELLEKMNLQQFRDGLNLDLKADLDEINRRHRRGLLVPARRAVSAGRGLILTRALPWVAMVLRLWGLLIAATIAFSAAGWMITRPLGLAVAGVGLLYLEHRTEGARRG